MSSSCRVTVYCTAYNHSPTIAEALDSFLSQRTTFPFEVLVTDDASTDGTTEIIRTYAERYPGIIRFFHQEKNRFSKGGNLYEEIMYPNTRGDYVAYCEGDDYWTDPDKLQLQVDFLDSHPDYSACVHNTMYHYCGTDRPEAPVSKWKEDRDLTFADIIPGMSHCFHTSSVLGRAALLCNPPDFQAAAYAAAGFTDYSMSLHLAMHGPIRYLARPMSVYRVNSNPESWKSGYDGSYRKKLRFVQGEIVMMETILVHSELQPDHRRLTEQELLKRRYELLYLEGKTEELVKPPYDALYRQEPLPFKARTTLKRLFPGLHEIYRRRRGYQ